LETSKDTIVSPPKGEKTRSGCSSHAKFQAYRPHLHRDICPQRDTKIQRSTADL